MASRRASLSGPDWRDVTGNLIAFEAINNVKIVLRLETGDRNGYADLLVAAVAEGRTEVDGVLPVLASANVKCSDMKSMSLEAVVIRLLYQLDSNLADGEFAKTVDGA